MSTPSSERQRVINLVVGVRAAGKSTFTARLVKGYQGNAIVWKHPSSTDDKAFEFLTLKTPENWRQGAAPGQDVKCKMAGDKKQYRQFLQWVQSSYRNGILVIDDATVFERDRLTEEMNELFTNSRHRGIDLYLVYHGLSLLPIEQFIFVNNIVLFNTTDEIKYKANKIPRFLALRAGIQQARRNFQSTDPAIKYRPVIVPLQ